MKNRVLTFIIGILVGSIITTTAFLIYIKLINRNMNTNERFPINQNGQMQMPNRNIEEPPEKPEANFRPTNN